MQSPALEDGADHALLALVCGGEICQHFLASGPSELVGQMLCDFESLLKTVRRDNIPLQQA